MPSMILLLAGASAPLDTSAGDAAKYVMLGVIFVVLSGLLAFIFRLRYLSRHPLKEAEADELEAMVESEVSEDSPPKSW